MADTVTLPKSILDGTSDVWARKLITWFRFWDVNKTNFLRKEDMVSVVGPRLPEKIRGTEEDPSVQLWEVSFQPAQDHFQSDGVGLTDFLAYRRQEVLDPEKKKQAIAKFLSYMEKTFVDLDLDGNGVVDFEEGFKSCNTLFGLSRYQFQIAMAAVDYNSDGVAQASELMDALAKFQFGTDWDPTMFAYGPLANINVVYVD